MANRIRFNSNYTNDGHSLNIGKWALSTYGAGLGPSSDSQYYHAAQLEQGYAIYSKGTGNAINLRIDTDPIFILQKMGCPYDTLDTALMWARSQNILVTDNSFDETVTDGLVTYMDANHPASYQNGTDVLYNLSGTPKPHGELKVLGWAHHHSARPFYNYFESVAAVFDVSPDLTTIDVIPSEVAAKYDLVVADAYVWSLSYAHLNKLKDFVDAGVSVVAMGNDARITPFVQAYDSNGRGSHDILVEDDAIIGYEGETFTYGSGDVYGGILTLKNGAVPIYRRADSGLITGYVYDNHKNGASLYFDQEGLGDAYSELAQAGFNHVLRHVGNKATKVNTPYIQGSNLYKSWMFDTSSYFDLGKTAVDSLTEDITLTGFCKQGETGLPHQTVIATATDYRNGLKLMSKYHDQGVTAWVGNNNGTDSYVLASGNNITNDGLWHHVAATRNSTTGELKVYVDGQLEGVASYSTGTIASSGTGAIGTDYHSKSYNYVGNIGYAKAYNRTLSADEILKEYYGSNIVTSTTPRLLFDPANPITMEANGVSGQFKDLTNGDILYAEGSSSESSEHNGIIKLNTGRVYMPTTRWYGKMAISWWMRYNGPVNATNFYTESHRTVSGCSRIYSPILSDGRFLFQVWDNSSRASLGGTISTATNTNVCDGEWHQVTCQWSNGTGNIPRGLYVYVDGLLEGYTDMVGNDGGYEHMHLGGSYGCAGTREHNVDFGPIIQYKNYNLSHEEVGQNHRAHVARFK